LPSEKKKSLVLKALEINRNTAPCIAEKGRVRGVERLLMMLKTQRLRLAGPQSGDNTSEDEAIVTGAVGRVVVY
jgi:hypothetical protein